MNVLFVHDCAVPGGLETRLLTHARVLQGRGHRVTVACRPGPFERAYTKDGIEVVALDHSNRSHLDSTVRRLREVLRERAIDYCDLHPYWGVLPAGIAVVAERIPFGLNFHGLHEWDSPDLLFRTTVGALLSRAALLTANAPPTVRWVSEAFAVPPGQILCVPNCIEPAQFSGLPPPQQPGRRLLLLTRLDSDKLASVTVAGEVAAAYARRVGTGVELRVVGAGNAQAEAREILLLALRGTGVPLDMDGSTSDPASVIGNCDAVLGMGRVVLEALAAARPVVLCGVLGNSPGVCRPEVAESWYLGNFNGRSLPTVPPEEVAAQLAAVSREDCLALSKWVEQAGPARLEPWREAVEAAARTRPDGLNAPALAGLSDLLKVHFDSLAQAREAAAKTLQAQEEAKSAHEQARQALVRAEQANSAATQMAEEARRDTLKADDAQAQAQHAFAQARQSAEASNLARTKLRATERSLEAEGELRRVREQELARCEQERQRLEQLLASRTEELQSIYESLGWRLVSQLRMTKNTLAPTGTRLRGLLEEVLQRARHSGQ